MLRLVYQREDVNKLALEFDKFEANTNELLNPDLDHARRTELLTEMKQEVGAYMQETSDKDKEIADLKVKREELLEANSKLFRQIPTTYEKTKEEIEKSQLEERSQTITLSDFGA